MTTEKSQYRMSTWLRLPTLYLNFLVTLFLSRTGDSLLSFTMSWIAYELTHSAIVMGSMFATSVLPIVLFGPVVGALIDRWDQRRLMIYAICLMAGLISLIPLLYLFGFLQLWHLYMISFLVSVLSLLFDVSTNKIIPLLVHDELTRANAGLQAVFSLAAIVGPSIAGWLIAWIGGFGSLWVTVLAFTAPLLAVYHFPKEKSVKEVAETKHLGKEMIEGFRWLVRNRINLSLSIQAMMGNLGQTAVYAVLMYYLLSSLHLTPQQSGLVFMSLGIGGLLGSLLAVPLDQRFRRGLLFPILLSAGMFGLLVIPFLEDWLWIGIFLGLLSGGNLAWNTIVTSYRQESIPRELFGRVMGFSRMLTRLSMPIGAMIGAFLMEWHPASVFIFGAICKAVEVGIAVFSPMRKL